MHFLLFFILPISVLIADESFINTDDFSLAHTKLESSYCKHTHKQDRTLCISKKLHTIDSNVKDLPIFMKGIQNTIDPILSNYQKNNVKKDVLDTIEEFEGDVSGEWYNNTEINLFSKTETSYTLKINNVNYEGGAHGSDEIDFHNFEVNGSKPIALMSLFLPNSEKKLLKIAEAHYKRMNDMKLNESLIADSWFDNNFTLAGSFAITPVGLYFLYNSYEIKPYSEGQTTFMLPYALIKNIIDPKGALSFALNKKYTHRYFAYSDDPMDITLNAVHNKDNSVDIEATLQAHKYNLKKAWLSLSFPQIENKKAIVKTKKVNFQNISLYDKTNNIYNTKWEKSMKANYLLVEAEEKSPNGGKVHTMHIKLIPPKNIKGLIIDIRGLIKTPYMNEVTPYWGTSGQQGYKNIRVFLPF